MKWAPIPGAPGYLASDSGLVKGPRSDELSQQSYKNGYKYVWMFVDGRKIRQRVHLLILMAFNPPISIALQVNHIDGDRANNALANLEWVTSSQNKLHACDQLGSYPCKAVIGTCLKTGREMEFPSVNATHEAGFSPQNISACLNGRRKTHANHTWRFK